MNEELAAIETAAKTDEAKVQSLLARAEAWVKKEWTAFHDELEKLLDKHEAAEAEEPAAAKAPAVETPAE